MEGTHVPVRAAILALFFVMLGVSGCAQSDQGTMPAPESVRATVRLQFDEMRDGRERATRAKTFSSELVACSDPRSDLIVWYAGLNDGEYKSGDSHRFVAGRRDEVPTADMVVIRLFDPKHSLVSEAIEIDFLSGEDKSRDVELTLTRGARVCLTLKPEQDQERRFYEVRTADGQFFMSQVAAEKTVTAYGTLVPAATELVLTQKYTEGRPMVANIGPFTAGERRVVHVP